MAEYVINVYRDGDTREQAFAYKLVGISTIASAYAVLAHYQTNHCPKGFWAEIVRVESDYPYWESFYKQKECVA